MNVIPVLAQLMTNATPVRPSTPPIISLSMALSHAKLPAPTANTKISLFSNVFSAAQTAPLAIP